MGKSQIALSKLKPTDFSVVADADSTVNVSYNRRSLFIAITDAKEPTKSHIDTAQNVIRCWESKKRQFASRTQTFLQRFLKGRKVSPDDLLLFGLELMAADGEICGGKVLFRVAGDYSVPHYKLDQFEPSKCHRN